MLDERTLDQILALTLSNGLSEGTLQTLRSSWPNVHFTYCLDDEICGVEPVRSAGSVNVYLVNGRGGCPTLTGDLETATGLVLAEVEDDGV